MMTRFHLARTDELITYADHHFGTRGDVAGAA